MANIYFDSEKELEDLIYSKMQKNQKCPMTSETILYSDQQFKLGAYGVADIVYAQDISVPHGPMNILFTIIEVKKEKIKPESVGQLSRYIRGLTLILEELDVNYEFSVNGILVAPEIDMSGDVCFLTDLFDDISVFTVSYDLDNGVDYQEQSGWYRKDKTIPDETKGLLTTINRLIEEDR